MDEINKIREFYKLKNITRGNPVMDRKESPAEHTWSALILADYFLTKSNLKLDRLKVYELLMYHDVIEIEAGDTYLLDHEKVKNKKEVEKKALQKLVPKLPTILQEKFTKLFQEFEDQKTIEARFAKAIDALDAEIHELDYKEDWKGWTEKFLREKRGPLFEEFPNLKEFFEKSLEFCNKNNYFNQ